MGKTREEQDSMGVMHVPAEALWGAQTARAIENFPVSNWPIPQKFIVAIGLIKQAAATIHKDTGRIDPAIADAIIAAAQEVIDGKLVKHFAVDVFQTGSGTSTNMNANEVIANRAIQLLGAQVGDRSLVHPNDHVNMSQSSNDVIPTALHVATAVGIHDELTPAIQRLQDALQEKADQFDSIVKIARTHLMDAVPIRLGQEFSGYSAQLNNAMKLLDRVVADTCELTIGGTAVGTGLNAPGDFGSRICKILAAKTKLPFYPASNRFAQQGARDTSLFASAVLRNVAVAMGKIASDIRLLGSGPRCGLGELLLPAVQPGSSIMPGKVNPVICESVVQVVCQVIGCDAAIAAGSTGGVGSILELNVATPMIAANLMAQIKLLTNVAKLFAEKCIRLLRPNEQRCSELIEQSLAMVTALVPKIGYDAAAQIAKEAYASGETIRQICLKKNILPAKALNELLDARKQTG